MKPERQQRRPARIVASPLQRYWNSTPQATSLKDGEVRAMFPAGRLRESKGRGPARNMRSSWTAKEMSGWAGMHGEIAFKNLPAMGNFSGILAIVDRELLRDS